MLACNDNAPRPRPVCVVAADESWIGHAYYTNLDADRMAFLYPSKIWLRKGSSFFRARHALDYSVFQFPSTDHFIPEYGVMGFDDDIDGMILS